MDSTLVYHYSHAKKKVGFGVTVFHTLHFVHDRLDAMCPKEFQLLTILLLYTYCQIFVLKHLK